MRTALACYGAGSLGALAMCLSLWLAGRHGVHQSLGVALAPSLAPWWLYPRLVWGGLAGLAFLLAGRPTLGRALLLSFLPAAVDLAVVYPFELHQGFAGLKLGLLTPLVVWLHWALWSLVTALTLRLS